MSTKKLQALLGKDKMESHDTDERNMAVRDLSAILEEYEGTLDSDIQDKITKAILKRLKDDPVGDVKTECIKFLDVYVGFCNQTQVTALCGALASQAVAKSEISDVFKMGLQRTIQKAPIAMANAIVKSCLGVIVKASMGGNEFGLELLNALLINCAEALQPHHHNILKTLLAQIEKQDSVAKRAVECLGSMTPGASEATLTAMILESLGKIGGKHDIFAVRAISTISKAAGFRSARFLARILPKLKASCEAHDTDPDTDGEVTDSLCELKSSCLDAIGAFLVSVPHEVGEHVDSIVSLFLDYVDYNPSISSFEGFGDDDDDGWGDGGGDDNDWGSGDDADGFGKDNSGGGFGGEEDNVASDRSFQVRKSAINGLTNLFTTRPDLLKALAPRCAAKLLVRFDSLNGENEASARLALFACMRALVQICLVADNSKNADTTGGAPRPKLVRQTSGFALLDIAPEVCNATLNLLKKGESETLFSLLTDVVNVTCGTNLDGLPNEVVARLITDTAGPLTADSYKDKAVQCAAFGLLQTVMVCHAHTPQVTQKHSNVLAKAIGQGLQSKAIAIIVSACSCAAAMAQAGATPDVFAALLPQVVELTQRKYDGEKRKAACHAVSCILCNFGNKLDATQVQNAVDALTQSLTHGDTRTVTMKGLQSLSQQNPALLEKQGGKISATLLTFLQPGKARPLRLRALHVLRSMLVVSSAKFTDFDLLAQSVDVERPDIPVATAALDLASAVLNKSAAHLQPIARKIIPKAKALGTMSAFNGKASLCALKNLFSCIRCRDSKFATGLYKEFAASPKDADSKTMSEAGLKEIAVRGACMAALSTKTDIATIAAGLVSSSDYVRCLSFQALGGLGAIIEPSTTHAKVINTLAEAVRDSSVPAAKRFAAKAYGSLAASNMSFYLKKFRHEIQARCDGEAAVTTLGQMIELSDKASLGTHAADLLPTLLKNSGDKDESVRRMVSQALGRLAVQDPGGVLPTLKAQLEGSHWSKAAAIASLQFAIDSSTVRARVMTELPDYLKIGFAAIDVETASPEERVAVADAVVTTLTTLYRKYLVDAAPYLRYGSTQCVWPRVLPLLCQVKAWRQTIDFGAFKKLVDRGVPIRMKVANLISLVLSSKPKWFDAVPFYGLVTKLLEDEEVGLKIITLKILCKLCSTDAAELVKNFKSFGDRLRKTALRSRRLGKDASEGHEDYQLFYWGCGTLKVIGQVPGIERNAKYATELAKVRKEKICENMMTKFSLPDNEQY